MLPQARCTLGEERPGRPRQSVIVISGGSGSQTATGQHRPPARSPLRRPRPRICQLIIATTSASLIPLIRLVPPVARPAPMADRKMGDTEPYLGIAVEPVSQTSECQAPNPPA